MWRFKTIPEDFVVREIPYVGGEVTACPDGRTFTHIELQKKGISTFDALAKVGGALGLSAEDLTAAGLKDEEGITSQVIAVRGIHTATNLAAVANQSNPQNDCWLRIERVLGYSNTGLRPGLLHGNLFRVVVRGLSTAEASGLVDYIERGRAVTFVNYYDTQRFGLPDKKPLTHYIGEALLEGRFSDAMQFYLESGNLDATGDSDAGGDPRKFFQRLPRRMVDFFLSSYASSQWNAAAAAIVGKAGGESLVVDPCGTTLYALPVEAAVPSLLPMRQYRVDRELKPEVLPCRNRPLAISADIFLSDVADDELFMGSRRLQLSFMLPKGCYATMLIRQLETTVTVSHVDTPASMV